jgi:RNA polymerase sigma-70 factor (ECF subfamily)
MPKRQLFGNRPVLMKEADDFQVVRQCLGGDTQAFGFLVEKYQGIVYNVALRMVRDAADAEDIAQAAFLKAYEKLGTYNERFRFYSWLYRITVNEALNFLDRQKRFARLDEGAEDPQQVREVEGEARERSERIQEGLLELKPDHRVVLILRHFEELSYEEIGAILDIPIKRVKSRLFSARQVLRAILVKKGL